MTHFELLADFFEPHRPLLIHFGELQALLSRAEQPIREKCRGVARARGASIVRQCDRSFPRKGENWDDKIDLPGMTISGDLATIPIYGMIGDKLDPFLKWYFDATDLRDVNDEIEIAESDPAVKRVLFVHDSPGGSSRNVPETSDHIAAMKKKTVAFADGMMASASYWLAAAAGGIGATRGSDIGSIGVYSTFYDKSKLASDIGIKVQVFSSGKYKGMGVPGTSLTTEQAAWIQKDVNEMAAEFKQHVRDSRAGLVADSAMEGQTFGAAAAKSEGLVDVVAATPLALL